MPWNNPQKSTDVVGISRNIAAVVRLVGAVLSELNDDWAVENV